jgi:hypothetical protein
MPRKNIETKCNECDRNTYQSVLFTKSVQEQDADMYGKTIYMVIQCGGCRTVSFLMRDPMYSYQDEPEYSDYHFPLSREEMNLYYTFHREEDLDEIPSKIRELYEEIKPLFRNESSVIAGTGLRMLVEGICLQQKIAGANLKEKIIKLNEMGIISNADLPILDKLRIMGNQSAHEIKGMSIDKLSYALDIINHASRSIYILPKINKRLKI